MCIRQKQIHYYIRSESILSVCVQGLTRMIQPSSEAHVPVVFLGTHLCAQPRTAEAETMVQNGAPSCT